jgi:hypothetical protein
VRNFSEIEEELGLKKYLESEMGTLYFVPSSPGSKRVIVRRFDNILSPEYVNTFAEMLQACQQWVESSSTLNEFVRVEQPLEVGTDFISRTHHTYITSTDSYAEEHNPAEEPPELKQMRSIVRLLILDTSDHNLKIIQSVMSRSLIDPSTKTYLSDDEMKFIVVEPKFYADDVKSWKVTAQV